MKKKIILIILLLMIGFNIEAMTLKPTGATGGTSGSNITVYINLERTNQEKTISAVDGKITWDTNFLSLVESKNLMNNWTELSGVSNNGMFAYGNLSLKDLVTSTSQNIIQLTFKINDNASGSTTITIANPSATDEVGNAVLVNGGSHTIKVLSKVDTLSSLKINGTNVDNFNAQTLTYSKSTNDSSVKIEATPTDSKATVTGTGTKELKYGLNTFKVVVTSEANTKKVYTLNITRIDNRDKTNTLKTLTLSSGSINFKSGTTTYNVNVANNIEKITIDSTLTSSKSKYVNGFGNRSVNLKLGKNTIYIKVQAENGEVKTYTLNVTREDNRDKTNTLKTLTLSSGSINFNSNTTTYNVNVANDIEKITINSTLTSSKSKYVNGFGNREVTLKEGNNTVYVKVQAENGDVKTYTLNITRQTKVDLVSDIKIENYDINFSKDVYIYDLKIGEENQLNINVTLNSNDYKYEVIGNENLVNGSVITIKARGLDQEIEYKINISKDEVIVDDPVDTPGDNDDNSKVDFVTIACLGFLVVAIIIFVISIIEYKRRKKEING